MLAHPRSNSSLAASVAALTSVERQSEESLAFEVRERHVLIPGFLLLFCMSSERVHLHDTYFLL